MFTRMGSTLILACLLAVPCFADSQARIVRLSDVEGIVQVDRNTGQGFEKAFVNMPISEGMKVETKADGRAEVEFEDGSTVRLTPDTQIDFPQLSLRDSGARVSTVEVEQGTAYVDFRATKDDEFTVNFDQESIALTKPTHLRVDRDDEEATVGVIKGDVTVDGPSGTVDVSRHKQATFDLSDDDKYTVENYQEDPNDSWDKQQAKYQDRYMASNSYNSYAPYNYGMSDLNYYGNFVDLPGYGLLWQPYFTGYGWDPYANGAWLYYPGYGYNWVSAYPWGWTPYHSGSWVFLPGQGWFWQPGGNWYGWNTVPRVVNPPAHYVPPKPPTKSGTTTVWVGPKPPVTAPGAGRMTILNGSAGLGVPRGSISNLGKISRQVNDRGSATVKMHPAPVMTPVTPSAMPRASAPAVRSTAPAMSAPRPAPMPHPMAAPRAAPAPHAAPTPHGVPHN